MFFDVTRMVAAVSLAAAPLGSHDSGKESVLHVPPFARCPWTQAVRGLEVLTQYAIAPNASDAGPMLCITTSHLSRPSGWVTGHESFVISFASCARCAAKSPPTTREPAGQYAPVVELPTWCGASPM
jgi:hypothetical protein